ncbi:MAG: glycosyltransferase [Pseudomonadota bacterium]|nr:glycosyltransferase [Pseudomonadota bacterium]
MSAGNSADRAESTFISVVIPAFNEAAFIEETVKSVLAAAERYRGRVEIIVVDNNSTDGTGEIARELGVTVVFEPRNQIAGARNAGARAATGACLVFLDADTWIEGDILDKVHRYISSGKVIGGGAWVEPDSSWLGRLFFRLFVNYPLALKNVTVGPFLYCDRAAFDKVGGFDEELFAAEEFSLAKRLKIAGKRVGKCWKIIRYHRSHGIVTSDRKFERFGCLEMARSNAHLVWKPHEKIRQQSECRFWYDVRK